MAKWNALLTFTAFIAALSAAFSAPFGLTHEAWAQHCSGDLTLDQLRPGTTIELKRPFSLDLERAEAARALTHDTHHTVYWVQGKPVYQLGSLAAVQRSIALKFPVHPEVKFPALRTSQSVQYEPFTCTLVAAKPLKTGVLKLESNAALKLQGCPISELQFLRAGMDFNPNQMTLDSLRINLGPDFVVNPQCDAGAVADHPSFFDRGAKQLVADPVTEAPDSTRSGGHSAPSDSSRVR